MEHRNSGSNTEEKDHLSYAPTMPSPSNCTPTQQGDTFHLNEEKVSRHDTATAFAVAANTTHFPPTATSCSGEIPSVLISVFDLNGNTLFPFLWFPPYPPRLRSSLSSSHVLLHLPSVLGSIAWILASCRGAELEEVRQLPSTPRTQCMGTKRTQSF